MASIDVGIHPDPAGISAHRFPAARPDDAFSTLSLDTDGGRVSIYVSNRAVLASLQVALTRIRADMDAAAQTASDQVPTSEADWPAGPPGEAAEAFGR